MEEEVKAQKQAKNRRIAVGATVAGVLVIVFLLVVLIIQFVQMGVYNSERKKLDRSIAEYQERIGTEQEILDDYLKGDALYWCAVQRGWKK